MNEIPTKNFIPEQGATDVESVKKRNTNHKRLRTITVLENLRQSFSNALAGKLASLFSIETF